MTDDVPTPGSRLWSLVETAAERVSIYDGPEVFLDGFAALRPELGHLFAAHWCQAEVCNGGFLQFFHNSTGILAPEAADGFRAIGLSDPAEIVTAAMGYFGKACPRERFERLALLDELTNKSRDGKRLFDELDSRFYEWIQAEPDRWEHAADEYALKHLG